jgi:hypothetical protein
LFEEHPDLIDMKICLGHAGGAQAWLSWSEPRGLAREALGLAQDFPRVFLDFGHFEEIARKEFSLAMFTSSFAVATKEYPKAMTRAMFGSDWHVVSTTGQEPAWVNVFSPTPSTSHLPVRSL